jgi:ribosome-binding protein aMBF1 (putative translation factor)
VWTCEDCGQTVQGTDTELGAILAGITVCDECIASFEDETVAYEQIMAEEGYECVFDPESMRFVARVIAPAATRGAGE